VLIYGDTNSTLAAALAASKLHMPVAHVEAGLRSFNMRMPEEINRILSDRVSAMLLCPTTAAVRNLANEGIHGNVHLVGDVMYDVALHFAAVAESRSDALRRLDLQPRRYILTTCHRAENTDDPERLKSILRALATLAESMPVVLPLHPRTLTRTRDFGLSRELEKIRVIEPVSYLDMVQLEKNAAAIVTDSGGVQKEAFFYGVPCVTARDETEWVETVDSGWNVLVGADEEKIIAAVRGATDRKTSAITPYGDGHAAERIVSLLRNGS
jgi:UDP-GlcNAc3NAcA epimerase